MRRLIVALSTLGLVALVACEHKAEHYQTTVQIMRAETVRDRRGTVVDVDLEYVDCPGEQREIFQADAKFAECLGKYKPGEKLQATIAFQKMPDGHFDSEVDRVGDCTRVREALDERSYEVVHECHDLTVNGLVIGFRCDRKPTKELLAKCPWFRRT